MAFIKTGDSVSVEYFDSDGEKVSDEELQQLADSAQTVEKEESQEEAQDK